MSSNLVPIIGLEIHVELNTITKMFCGCLAGHFKKEPNTQVCPVCLGLPGALPVPNKEALKKSIKVGLALGGTVNQDSFFERKNYFYPDLPKGYQISQYQRPLCVGGQVEIDSSVIRINRAHQEEDTAKLVHKQNATLIDFNRSGVPLLEIVTEPDVTSAGQAIFFLKELQLIIRRLGVSDADMEKGSMRLEANISLGTPLAEGKKRSSKTLPDYRIELKNINSFRFLRRALEREIQRQGHALEQGEILKQETRGYDEKTGKTYLQRSKEEAHDYRYFPEPDIPPLYFSQEEIEAIRSKLPELPAQDRQQYHEAFGLSWKQVEIIVSDEARDQYFQQLVSLDLDPQEAARLVINKPELLSQDPKELVQKIKSSAKEVIDDPAKLKEVAKTVCSQNKKAVADYRAGKESALQALLGGVMRETKGKADPQLAIEVLKEILTKVSTVKTPPYVAKALKGK